MSASDCISALEACGGNNSSMSTAFEKWIKGNVKAGHAFHWSGQDHIDIFGCFTNDSSRSTACEKWARHVLKCGGRLAIEDVAAMCSLTSNETSKENICIACAPACSDGDRSSITDQCSNSIIRGNINELKFGTRKWNSDEVNLSDDDDGNGGGDGDEGNYDGPPPPGFGGGGMPGFGGGGMPGFGGGGMPGFGGGGMPGFGAMPNPMGGNPAGGFFNTDDNDDDNADDFGDDDNADDFGDDDDD